MVLKGTPFDVDENFYMPEFIWNFWLESCPADMSAFLTSQIPPPVGLHVYDTYNNEHSKGLTKHPFLRGVFDQMKHCAPALEKHPAWDTALSAFYTLEKDAETAARSLLQQADAKPRTSQLLGVGFEKPMPNRIDKPKLSLAPHSLRSLQKYLIFLRFRNSYKYGKLLKLANGGSLFLRKRGASLSPKHYPLRLSEDRVDPLSDWVMILQSFTCFFTGLSSDQCDSYDFICECIHRRYSNILEAEICIGVASDPDEYILSPSCFGFVEEGGAGHMDEFFHYFFPLSPRFTIYLLIDAPLAMPSTGRSEPAYFRHTERVCTPLDYDVESAVDVYQRNAILLRTCPCYVIFVSARSMTRTLKYYNDRRWSAEILEYSNLLRICFEESVTYTLLAKASIEVIDLTDDVTTIGECAVSFGTFADVWKGVWTDRQERGKQTLVALKSLRANLVGYVQERLLRRLMKEVKAWHRLEHPNVARLHGIVQLPNTIAMVSSWCENGTIVKYLRETNPEANRLQLLYEIASGIEYLHSCRPAVIHGDLKGSNVLIDDLGRAIITDFGLAKVKEEVSDVSELPTSFFAGSTRWMAPELILAQLEDEMRRAPITTATDVYAFSSICLEILTGKLPYPHRRSDQVVIIDIMNGVKPSRGSQCLVGVAKTTELWEMMDQCWDQMPRARPDINQMCTLLGRLRHL